MSWIDWATSDVGTTAILCSLVGGYVGFVIGLLARNHIDADEVDDGDDDGGEWIVPDYPPDDLVDSQGFIR